jgi:hypothetical protein
LAEPIWNRQGRVVGWLDGDNIRDREGGAKAFIYGENVIAYRNGGHRGWFVSGVFRDRRGRVVAFISSATRIMIPARSGIPGVPSFGGLPGRSIPSIPGRPGIGGWGDTTFEDLLVDES